jgi:hypothetical protein
MLVTSDNDDPTIDTDVPTDIGPILGVIDDKTGVDINYVNI